jgi:hypothetical protein
MPPVDIILSMDHYPPKFKNKQAIFVKRIFTREGRRYGECHIPQRRDMALR